MRETNGAATPAFDVEVETIKLTRWLLLPAAKQLREYRFIPYEIPASSPGSIAEQRTALAAYTVCACRAANDAVAVRCWRGPGPERGPARGAGCETEGRDVAARGAARPHGEGAE